MRGGIAIHHCGDVGAEGIADGGIFPNRLAISLADHVARDVGMRQALREPVYDGGFQRVVMQQRQIDKGRQFGLTPDHFLSLAANTRPDRIDFLDHGRLELLGHSSLHAKFPGRL